jgi:hypothetical protein
MDQSGGAMAKLLGLLLVLALAASTALYVYGRHQRPLAIDELTAAAANRGSDTTTVTLGADGQLRFATILRNDGRLPVTIEGVAAPTGKPAPLLVTSFGLGDGSDATEAAGFTPVALDPGTGIGVVVVFGVNPAYPCDRLGADAGATMPLPAIGIRFSSYGVTSTQELNPDGAPAVDGVTRAACEGTASTEAA